MKDRVANLTPDVDGELLLFPAPRTAAFSRRDTLLPGFRAAARAVSEHGFSPVVRPVGGHLAVYDEGSLVLHLLSAHPDPRSHIVTRFTVLGEAIAQAFRHLGVDARLGPVPGEYCDGKYSVNHAGRAKLAGTGQRITRHGYLFSAVLMVQSSAAVTQALTDAYRELGLDFSPESVGAVEDAVPTVTLADVHELVLAQLAEVVTLRGVRGLAEEGAGRSS